jgi:hypothetical protein
MPTAMARAKLLTVLRGKPRREMLGTHRRPAGVPASGSVGTAIAAA